jgi:hypothetical protein
VSESDDIELKLNWLLENAIRLDWRDANSTYNDFYKALWKRVNHRHDKKDLEVISIWTSGRVAEGYAFLLEPFPGKEHSSMYQFEQLGEICTAMRLEVK